jgi:hypothetical protein
MGSSAKAKPVVRRGRKATGLSKDEKIAGLPGRVTWLFLLVFGMQVPEY